jgi:hypothetical protein
METAKDMETAMDMENCDSRWIMSGDRVDGCDFLRRPQLGDILNIILAAGP